MELRAGGGGVPRPAATGVHAASSNGRGGSYDYDALVPPSFVRTNGSDRSTRSASARNKMRTIAEATGVTFSSIENEATIQDGRCIGWPCRSSASIDVACVDTGVCVTTVKFGRYKSHADEDGRAAAVDGCGLNRVQGINSSKIAPNKHLAVFWFMAENIGPVWQGDSCGCGCAQ
uniref:Uncharacterized protein n=1 Tax=Oryza meridionalis TaxID=40149 RepID=A0A0E0E7Y8_9ORYZ